MEVSARGPRRQPRRRCQGAAQGIAPRGDVGRGHGKAQVRQPFLAPADACGHPADRQSRCGPQRDRRPVRDARRLGWRVHPDPRGADGRDRRRVPPHQARRAPSRHRGAAPRSGRLAPVRQLGDASRRARRRGDEANGADHRAGPRRGEGDGAGRSRAPRARRRIVARRGQPARRRRLMHRTAARRGILRARTTDADPRDGTERLV